MSNNPFRYRGYYYDKDPNLYYLNARYYDQGTRRFVNGDEAGIVTATPEGLTDKNLFAYCDNNPVVRIDQNGKIWNILIGAAVGMVVGGIVSAVSQLLDDEAPDFASGEFWLHVGVSAGVGLISGGLAASGAGLTAQVVVNALLNAAGSVADTAISGGATPLEYVVNAAEGAAFGAIGGMLGGKGTASKHTVNSFHRVLRNGNFSYYFSQITEQAIKEGLKAIPGIAKATLPALTKTFLRTAYQNNLGG